MWTFALTSTDITIWYSTNSKHHLLASSLKTLTHVKKPKHFPVGLQLDFINDLFDTVDMGVTSNRYQDYLFWEELLQRAKRGGAQALLTRLRPLLPIPYWSKIGLEAPIFGTKNFPKIGKGDTISQEFIANQTYKMRYFMQDSLKILVSDNNTGALGLTLRQLDTWKLSLLTLKGLSRNRPLIIALEDCYSSLSYRMLDLNPHDCLSMAAQVSLIKYVAHRVLDAFKYSNINLLRPLFSDLILTDNSSHGYEVTWEDPFAIGVVQNRIGRIGLSKG